MKRGFEQEVAALRASQDDAAIAKVLRGKRGLLIAVAAKLVEERGLFDLVADMATAFETLVDGGVKADPGCRGKIAIARALHAMDVWEERVFVRGLRVIQIEGVPGDMGPAPDSADQLRGICGIAHVGRPEALDVLARLLADEYRNTRIAAAEAIGQSGRTDATALLRYKLHANDEDDPDVLAAMFDALFSLARESTTELAIELLGDVDARAEAAAIALGSARVSEATAALAAWCETCRPEQRQRVGYVALALLRNDEGNAILRAAMKDRGKADAQAAAKALATFRELLDDETRRAIDRLID